MNETRANQMELKSVDRIDLRQFQSSDEDERQKQQQPQKHDDRRQAVSSLGTTRIEPAAAAVASREKVINSELINCGCSTQSAKSAAECLGDKSGCRSATAPASERRQTRDASHQLVLNNSLESISSRFSDSSENPHSEQTAVCCARENLDDITSLNSNEPPRVGAARSRGRPADCAAWPERNCRNSLQQIQLDRRVSTSKQFTPSSPFKKSAGPKSDCHFNCRLSPLHRKLFLSNKPIITSAMSLAQQNQQNGFKGTDEEGRRPFDEKTFDAIKIKPGEEVSKKTRKKDGENAPAGSKKAEPPFMFAGIVAIIMSSILFSSSFLCLKLMPPDEGFAGKMKALFFRGFFICILCSISILWSKSTFIIRRDELLVNVLRAVFGTMAVFGAYSALIYIGMGDATALIFSSPVWTSILSHFIFNEPLYCGHLVALPLSLLGIVLIAHPGLILNVDDLKPLNAVNTNINNNQLQNETAAAATTTTASSLVASLAETIAQIEAGLSISNTSTSSNNTTNHTEIHYHAPKIDQLIGADIAISVSDPELTGSLSSDTFDQRWPGIVISLITSLLVSLTFIVLKFRKKTPIQTTTFWFSFTIMLFSAILMLFYGFGEIPSTQYEWSLLIGNGFFSWAGQSLFQWSFQYEEAGILSIIRTLDVATSFILSAIFLDDEIYWTSIAGSGLIVMVVASLMLNNYLQTTSCCQSKHNPQLVDGEIVENSSSDLNEKQSIYAISNKA